MTTIVHRDPRGSEADVVLTPDTAHVWTIALEDADPQDGAAGALSTEERERARRFRFDVDRRRFVAARTALRSILAGYLCAAPASVVFTTGPWGKPMLDATIHDTALRFNLSHSHELALVVVARDRDVGIDVERMRVLPDLEGIVARFFSAAERATLDRLPRDRRLHAFFRFWTVKEAYLKACGDGLNRALDHVDVELGADQQRASVRALDRPADERRWELFSLTPGPGYVAAVAVRAATLDHPLAS
jgi:4'-phosphopantetheinyl transferase